MQEICNCQPKGQGVIFKHYDDIPLNKIKQKIGNILFNKVRSEGLDKNNVSAFQDRIKEGRYQFNYDQPVVSLLPDGTYELICGEHRFQAHKGLKLETMFCSIVEFSCEESKLIFQSNENDEDSEFIKNPRTENDVILVLTNLLESGIITDIEDDKEINLYLGKLHQKSGDYPKLREKFRVKHGIASAVQTYENPDRTKWCQNYKPEVDFTEIVDGTSYLNKTFKGGKGKGGLMDLDYDPRCFFDSVSKLLREDVDNVSIVGSFNKATSDKIPKLRKYKEEKMIKDWQEKILLIAESIKNGKIDPINQINFLWCPQISDVDNMEDWA